MEEHNENDTGGFGAAAAAKKVFRRFSVGPDVMGVIVCGGASHN